MLYFENCATVKDVVDLKRSEHPDHGYLLKVPITASLMQVISYMNDHHVGAVFVYDDTEKIVGVTSERDIIRQIALFELEAFNKPIETIVTKTIYDCHINDKLKKVASDMADAHIRHIAVKDDTGNYIGVVSSSDVELFAGQG